MSPTVCTARAVLLYDFLMRARWSNISFRPHNSFIHPWRSQCKTFGLDVVPWWIQRFYIVKWQFRIYGKERPPCGEYFVKISSNGFAASGGVALPSIRISFGS